MHDQEPTLMLAKKMPSMFMKNLLENGEDLVENNRVPRQRSKQPHDCGSKKSSKRLMRSSLET